MSSGVLGPVSAWTAAAISCFATGLTLYVRWRDRPEPGWLLQRVGVQPNRHMLALFERERSGERPLCATLTNVGDGSAYRVLVRGVGVKCLIFNENPQDPRRFSTYNVVPRLQPGEDVGLFIWPDGVDWLLDGSLEIECIPAPTRHQRRLTTTIALSDPQAWLEEIPERPARPLSGDDVPSI